MLRQIKPKTARSKRALEKKEPQVNENPKVALFLKGSTCNSISQNALNNLHSLKRPLCLKFTKKNDIRPFEDPSSLEFFSEKNDASLMVFGHHSKKRPNPLTVVRMFDHKVLDMLELYIVPETFRTLESFKNKKCAVGLKPLLSFSGTPFDNADQSSPYTLFKSLFTDLFKGADVNSIDVEVLQYLISFSAADEVADKPNPEIHMRVYLIKSRRSGTKLPRVDVEEMGPKIDFRIGRAKEAEADTMKEALKRPKQLEPKTKKNIETDAMGDKIGRIHVGKQDFAALQTRKMKGLKRGRDEAENGDGDGMVMVDENDIETGGVPVKQPRLEEGIAA